MYKIAIKKVTMSLRWLYYHILSVALHKSQKSCFYYYFCAAYDVGKQLGTLWSEGHIPLFSHYIIIIMKTYLEAQN